MTGLKVIAVNVHVQGVSTTNTVAAEKTDTTEG